MMSLVIPVYKNEGNIASLVSALDDLYVSMDGQLEIIAVVDGSPDQSHAMLAEALPRAPYRSQLLNLSKNFGALAAVRAGLVASDADHVAVMAADLQEPPELVVEMWRVLSAGEADVVVGVREARDDPLLSRTASSMFWWLFRRFVQREMPPGGVDVFACSRTARGELLRLGESNSSLVACLFWIGFKRVCLPYRRQRREIGRSAWTLSKKCRYLTDSIYGFTDLPIRILIFSGVFGLTLSAVLGAVVLGGKVLGLINVPGYAATIVTVGFFGALNALGLGVIGAYTWRAFENTKARPPYIVDSSMSFDGKG